MRWRTCCTHPITALALSFCTAGALLLQTALAADTAPKFSIKPVAEKKLAQLPAGPLYWRIENLPSLAQAKAVESSTSLAAEVGGKVWLFTLGSRGSSTPGATRVAEIGPVSAPKAGEYLLRINDAHGAPGAITPVHTHPGSETFYVLSGELSQKTPHGVLHLKTGEAMPGNAAGQAMQVSSSGASDLNALVMFVVDGDKPFSTRARFE